MSGYTPGPWAVSKNDRLLFGAVRGNGLEPLGFVYAPALPDISEVGKRAIHDVHLIAAAPELLEALRIAVRQNDHDMLMTGEELRQCYAAIAKATGATP